MAGYVTSFGGGEGGGIQSIGGRRGIQSRQGTREGRINRN